MSYYIFFLAVAVISAFTVIVFSWYRGRKYPCESQILLEDWWNEDPELRYVEVLCGQNLRVCVRLYEVTLSELGTDKVAEFEAGTLVDAITGAVTLAKSGLRFTSGGGRHLGGNA